MICPKPADAKLPRAVEQLTLVVTSMKQLSVGTRYGVIRTWLPGKLLLVANVHYGVPAQDGTPTPEGLISGSRGDDSVPASMLAVLATEA